MDIQVDFILTIEAFRDQFQKYLPKKLYDLLCTNNTERFWVYHDLSVWQKLQLSGQKYTSGEEFIAVVEVGILVLFLAIRSTGFAYYNYSPATGYIIDFKISVGNLHLVYYFTFQRSQERKFVQKQHQVEAEVREVIRSLGKSTLRNLKQETMKEAINELEMSVSRLSRGNEEMKKLVSCLREENSELKHAVLELCSHSRRQERLILKLAQKHGIESDPVTQD